MLMGLITFQVSPRVHGRALLGYCRRDSIIPFETSSHLNTGVATGK